MKLRKQNIKSLREEKFDCLILGGGINGAVAAAALAAKGAKVALIDKGDFAGETSSHSSNLAWGGIKYLESREFSLVNKLCKSRNQLMDYYPSTVKEIRFLTTIFKGFRFPPVFIYCGSLLYWLFGRFRTRAPVLLSATQIKQRESAINSDNAIGGLEYSDCFLHDNDSRFVFNFIKNAMKSGAVIANYVEATTGNFDGKHWRYTAKDLLSDETFTLQARTLINACGPWVDQINNKLAINTEHRHLFSKGVHLTVPKIGGKDRVLAFFASDGRLFFVIPMGPTTCIGTTDTQVNQPEEARVTEQDRQFLLDNANRCLDLAKPLTRDDIIAERCGVRPLAVTNETDCDDWVALSRKHAIDSNPEKNLISIFGGKITDCINVGEEIAAKSSQLGIELSDPDTIWYGEPALVQKNRFMQNATEIGLDELTAESASEPLSQRLWRRYGMDAFAMLDAIKKDNTQAKLVIGKAEYIRCEIEYTAEHEMVSKLEDFLRRRSKISMVIDKETIRRAPGLTELSKILFAEDWENKLQEYLEQN